jgi:hypothetical protein
MYSIFWNINTIQTSKYFPSELFNTDLSEGVFLAVQAELAVGDPVGHPAHHGAEVGVAGHPTRVARHVVVTQGNIHPINLVKLVHSLLKYSFRQILILLNYDLL